VGAIGGAAPVSKDKNLAIFMPRFGEELNQRIHLLLGDGVVGLLLTLVIFGDPIVHLSGTN
jgi:hypothetical protein